MKMQPKLTRRRFLQTTGVALVSAGLVRAASTGKAEPLKIGIRAASMKMVDTKKNNDFLRRQIQL